MCAWGSSFQWFIGIIGGSTGANRPNRRCLLVATSGIIEKTMGGRLIGIIRYMQFACSFSNTSLLYLYLYGGK